MRATIIEQVEVSPPKDGGDGGDNEFTLPMLFFDLLWYTFPASQALLFFEIPNCTKPHFMETIAPRLKHSLSLAVKHFLPLAGHIVHPSNPSVNKPILRYRPGDSISFTVAESKTDNFSYLTGKDPRVCDDFYSLVPEFPPEAPETPDGDVICPVLALQATLFPGNGLSLGIASHHAVGDATTILMFLQAWACLNRLSIDDASGNNNTTKATIIEEEELLKECGCLPSYNRETVIDIDGLDSFFWESVAHCKPIPPPSSAVLPIDRLRAKLVLKKEQVEMLKNYATARRSPNSTTRLSSYAVTCGFVWMCYSRSDAKVEEADQREVFTFAADCRERLSLPRTYFGNCVALAKAELKHGDLIGDNGFVTAVEAIANAIRDRVYAKEGMLSRARAWDDEFLHDLEGVERVYGVSGSTTFDIYNVDFGWGNPKKYEFLSVDKDRVISLCKFEDGFEIGFSRTKTQMDAFVKLFSEAIQEFTG